MKVHKTMENEKTILALEGRLDTTTSPTLQAELIPAFDIAETVYLDFEKLAYVSSAGLRVLLMGLKTAQSKGKALILKNVSKDIMEVFDMTGFTEMLTFE